MSQRNRAQETEKNKNENRQDVTQPDPSVQQLETVQSVQEDDWPDLEPDHRELRYEEFRKALISSPRPKGYRF